MIATATSERVSAESASWVHALLDFVIAHSLKAMQTQSEQTPRPTFLGVRREPK